MKYLIILFLFFSCQLNAKSIEVESYGHGNTKEEQIEEAKRNAVEKVFGSFLDSYQYYHNDEYKEQIDSFTFGSVESFEILEQTETYIKAKVVVNNDNEIKREETEVEFEVPNKEIKELQRNQYVKEKILKEIDNSSNALEFLPKKYTYKTDHVVIEGFLKYKDFWASKYKQFTQKEEIDLYFVKRCYTIKIRTIFVDETGNDFAETPEIIYAHLTDMRNNFDKPNLDFKNYFIVKQYYNGFLDRIKTIKFVVSCHNGGQKL